MSDAKDKPADHSPATREWPCDQCGRPLGENHTRAVVDGDVLHVACFRHRERLSKAAPALLKALRAMVKTNDDMSGFIGAPIVPVDGSPLDLARKALALVDGDG